MTALADIIARRIRREGPISLADYMSLALLHPEHGYYSRRDPLGRSGDFITAPEVSQMFGELIGLWCADYWLRSGSPAAFSLVELGPGRGTLMADALRAAAGVPGFLDAKRLCLVEASPTLKAAQRETLGPHRPRWLTSLSELAKGPIILIANEFFDALPLRQFTRRDGHWHENLVGLGPNDRSFRIMVDRAPAQHTPLLNRLYPSPDENDVAELPGMALSLVSEIAQRLSQPATEPEAPHGGAALIMDYGYYPSQPQATLQAVKSHERHDPLTAPGEADLTVHVNFEALLAAAAEAGADTWAPVGQGAFLEALGLETRVATLSAKAGPAQRRDIEAAKHRLTDPDQMGVLFKAAALSCPGFPQPAGFAEKTTEHHAGSD